MSIFIMISFWVRGGGFFARKKCWKKLETWENTRKITMNIATKKTDIRPIKKIIRWKKIRFFKKKLRDIKITIFSSPKICFLSSAEISVALKDPYVQFFTFYYTLPACLSYWWWWCMLLLLSVLQVCWEVAWLVRFVFFVCCYLCHFYEPSVGYTFVCSSSWRIIRYWGIFMSWLFSMSI